MEFVAKQPATLTTKLQLDAQGYIITSDSYAEAVDETSVSMKMLDANFDSDTGTAVNGFVEWFVSQALNVSTYDISGATVRYEWEV